MLVNLVVPIKKGVSKEAAGIAERHVHVAVAPEVITLEVIFKD